MKKTTIFRIKIISLLSVLLFQLSAYVVVTAQESGQALEIGPTVITLQANPGETIVAKINVRNVSSGDLVVQGEVNDFVASGEDGIPKILLEDNQEKDDNPYSIQNWISPIPQYTMVPKQIENMSIIISVPENATPGGYYGVIRFTGTPPELEGTGVSLSASIGSLLLLRVNGQVQENLSIEQFYATQNKGEARSLFEIKPIDFVVRLRNEGNIHQAPTGQISITDMFDTKIAAVNVNLGEFNVLPNSIRKFEQSLDDSVIGNKILFGKYTATLKVSYGSEKQELTQSIDFWVIPYTMIAIIATGLVIGFIVLRLTIKRYNQHIIDKALKSKRNR
jgi:hypothetical protein